MTDRLLQKQCVLSPKATGDKINVCIVADKWPEESSVLVGMRVCVCVLVIHKSLLRPFAHSVCPPTQTTL